MNRWHDFAVYGLAATSIWWLVLAVPFIVERSGGASFAGAAVAVLFAAGLGVAGWAVAVRVRWSPWIAAGVSLASAGFAGATAEGWPLWAALALGVASAGVCVRLAFARE